MKKILALGLALSLTLGLAGCSSGSSTPSSSGSTSGAPASSAAAEEEKSYTLKFSDQNAEGTPVITWAQKFAELLNEKTDGTLTVEIYPNASLAAYDMEPLQSGICDFTQYVPSSASDLDSRLGAFDAPYLYENEAHRQATFDYRSEPMKTINESLKDSNAILLGSFCSGYRQVTWNFEIKTLDDMKGAKIRVVPSDLYLQLFQAFGAAATPMNFSEVSTALITNVIDGQENPLSVICTNSLYEIQKYLVMTNHMPTNHGLWMNYNTYSKLSERQQQACWDAAYEASIWMDGQIAEAEEEYKQTCIDNGMTVIDEESGLDIAAFQAAGMTMYDAFAEDWGDMVDLIKSVQH